ncbi:hypothetical protein ACHAWF_013401 [Thalassiosira exigua]
MHQRDPKARGVLEARRVPRKLRPQGLRRARAEGRAVLPARARARGGARRRRSRSEVGRDFGDFRSEDGTASHGDCAGSRYDPGRRGDECASAAFGGRQWQSASG